MNYTNDTIQTIQMTEAERNNIRSALLSYMNNDNSVISIYSRRIVSPYTSYASLFHKVITSMFILMLVVVSGLGALGSANKSLPGEPLYFLKRNIAEPLIPLFLFSNEELVSYQAELVTKRVSEAKQLALSGQLTPEVKKDLEESVVMHTEKAAHIIDSVSTETNSTKNQVEQALTIARVKGEIEAQATTLDMVSVAATNESSNVIEPVSEQLDKALVDTKLTTSENTALGNIATKEVIGAYGTAQYITEKMNQSPLTFEQKEKVMNVVANSLNELKSTKDSLHSPNSNTTVSNVISVSSTLTSLSDEVNQLIATNQKITNKNQVVSTTSSSTLLAK